MHADDARPAPLSDRLGQPTDGDGAGVRRDERSGRKGAIELREERPLDALVLEDRLDGPIRARRPRGQVLGNANPLELGQPCVFREFALVDRTLKAAGDPFDALLCALTLGLEDADRVAGSGQ